MTDNRSRQSEADRDASTTDSVFGRRAYLKMSGIASLFLAGCVGDPSLPDGTESTSGLLSAGQAATGQFGYGGVPALAAVDSTTASEAEPNDDRGDASPIETDVTVRGELSGSEVDWFEFPAPAGDELAVTYEQSIDGVVTVVLYDASGAFLNQVYVSSTTPTTLSEPVGSDESYFVQVVNVEDGGGTYSLTVSSAATQTDMGTDTPTATPTDTPTATPTDTPTQTPVPSDNYGDQGYGEHGYGGVSETS